MFIFIDDSRLTGDTLRVIAQQLDDGLSSNKLPVKWELREPDIKRITETMDELKDEIADAKRSIERAESLYDTLEMKLDDFIS